MSDDVQLPDLHWLRGSRPLAATVVTGVEPTRCAPAERAAAKRVPKA